MAIFNMFAGKYKDNEAIEFSFDLNKDVPEDVAQEMVSTVNRNKSIYYSIHCGIMDVRGRK